MINDEANNYYYFAIEKLSELNSLGWLRGKKEASIINNNNNDFQNALDDSLNYQTIEKDPQRLSKLKPYINKYNWEGREVFQQDQKIGKNLIKTMIQLHLKYYM